MVDVHKNFAYSTVATAPSPATSGTSLVVAASGGALFPTVPFNATVWPAGTQPLASNAEIVRVTAISTDTFTITRTQESSSARTIVVGDQISATVTKKTLTDIESAAGAAYTPTLTASISDPTLGSGATQSGRWAQAGSIVMAAGRIQFGSSPNAGSGNYFVLLPVTAATGSVNIGAQCGHAKIFDSSGGPVIAVVVADLQDSTHALLRYPATWPTGTSTTVSNSAPWTWAQSDIIDFWFVYEAA